MQLLRQRTSAACGVPRSRKAGECLSVPRSEYSLVRDIEADPDTLCHVAVPRAVPCARQALRIRAIAEAETAPPPAAAKKKAAGKADTLTP